MTYPAARISSAAWARTIFSCSAGSATDADSSITFWLRRCTLQSRTPSVHTAPLASATTCTSTWWPPRMARSRNTVASPAVLPASELARSNASPSWPADGTSRMPRPPPPAVALTISGYPIKEAAARASARSATGPPLHAASGTPACSASRLDSILSPSLRITSADGPMKMIPSRSHSSANSAFSETNPQPGQTASARHSRRARSSSA